jgi:protoporphyrinogen oxidase
MKVKYLIAGAGPTGLGAAYRLKELGEDDFLVIEREAGPGGLARSFIDSEGFTWDIGGHVHFSRYEYYNQALDRALAPGDWLWHERDASVWIRDRFVPYPFQSHIRYLANEDTWRCLDGLFKRTLGAPDRQTPPTFLEWIYAAFGAGIAELFMVPYNQKVWASPLDRMSCDWIADRVAAIDLVNVVRNVVLAQDERSWGPNNRFRFPRIGGTGTLWRAMADAIGRDHVVYGVNLVGIELRENVAFVSPDDGIEYEFLVSSLPVDRLCTLVRGLPDGFVAAAGRLVHSTTHIVGLGLRGQPREELGEKKWMYFPESNCPFYRATVFSNYSPSHTPDPSRFWSLMTETSESVEKPLMRERLVDATIRGAIATRLIDSETAVVSTWVHTAPYGYPVPSLDRDGILDRVISALEEKMIFSRGRFGGWRYEVSNQDHSFMQGVELIDRLVTGASESTYVLPHAIGRSSSTQ